MTQSLSLHHRVRPATGPGPHPGILLLHGLGSNEEDLFGLAPWLDPSLVVVSARGPLQARWGTGYQWFDLDRDGPGLGTESMKAGLQTLATFTGEIAEAYEIDPARLVIGGFSMGAAMAGSTLLLNPQLAAAAVMISGFLPPGIDARCQREDVAGKPIFQAHGTLDYTVSIDVAHRTRDFLLTTPVNLTYREYPTGHSVIPEEVAEVAAWLGDVIQTSPHP